MFQDVGYTYQEIDEKKQGKKYPGGMAKKVFLNSESQKQCQPKPNGREDMKNNRQIHLGYLRPF